MKVSEIEEEVLKAEAEVRAAELALVMARAGNSATELSGKWETSDIDEDVERIESGKVRFLVLNITRIFGQKRLPTKHIFDQ